MKKLWVLLAIAASSGAFAADGASITAYQGYGVVREEREMNIPADKGELRVSDVPEKINASTVSIKSLTDPSFRVYEQDYQYDLVSFNKILSKYLDQEVVVEDVDSGSIQTYAGQLLGFDNGITLKSKEGKVLRVGKYSNVRFPDLPGGLVTRPTLVWNYGAKKTGTQKMQLSYQTGGFTWRADYNLIFSEGKDANKGLLDLGAWVSLSNESGAGYKNAKLKLMAGDVQKVEEFQRNMGALEGVAMAPAMMKMQDRGFTQKDFFEYHLYTLGRPVNLPDNSMKQLELFPAVAKVPAEKIYLYDGTVGMAYYGGGYRNTDQNFGQQSNKKVDVYLEFMNSEKNGLGMPLPAGIVRVNKQDSADSNLEFIGEDRIDHTPRDEKIRIRLGNAFDITGERKQTAFRVDEPRHIMEEDIEITLKNHKKEAVTVLVKEGLYRSANWKISQSNYEFKQLDYSTIHIPVKVEKDGTAVVKYTVTYSW